MLTHLIGLHAQGVVCKISHERQRPPLSVKILTMAQCGVETPVFHNIIVPESAQVDFSFDTPGIRIFKFTSCNILGFDFSAHF